MKYLRTWLTLLPAAVGWLLPAAAPAQPANEPPPVLRVESGGPTAYVTALAFSPDGRTLYAAGFDKVVRAWTWDGRRFTAAPRAYRVPLGPGTTGVINALAVSPDGDWLAVSGLGLWQQAAGFRDTGRVFPLPALTPAELRQRATIYLFQTRPPHAVKVLRGHQGPVVQMQFAPARKGKPTLLVSVAVEPGARLGASVGRACLWDIARAAHRDERGQLEDPGGALLARQTLTEEVGRERPGLAVRHTGDGPTQVRVAVAWGGDVLRVWEPNAAADTRVRTVADGTGGLNNGAAYTPDGRRLITSAVYRGGEAVPQGGLRVWNDAAAADPQPAADPVLLPPPADYAILAPRALGLVPPANGGTARYALTVVLARPTATEEEPRFWLLPIDLTAGRPLAPVFLWKGDAGLPVLAVSPDGGHVAVAGDRERQVLVYPVAGLVRANDPRPQVLASTGTVFRSVAFMERPAGRAGRRRDLGLFLSTRPSGNWGRPEGVAAADTVYNFARRRLTADPAAGGWQVSGPAGQGWKVTDVRRDPATRQGDRARWVISWQGASGAQQTTVVLGPNEEVTDALVLPPSKHAAVPLLALAVWDARASEPSLRLYRTDNGVQVRQYVGHAHRISALAASADGGLLASTANDQTVCVWRLTDVDRVLDRQGGLPGLVVEDRGKAVTVTRIDPDCPQAVREGLRVGDTVDALVVRPRGKPVALRNAYTFYDTLWNLKPGTRASLDVRRAGERDTLAFTVGQGVDEQHPLFFLFVPTGAGAESEWIGWSPLGPYDASGEDAESQVGWHFNPPTLEEAATFAPVSTPKYRQAFYQRDLLARLVGMTAPPAPPPVPRPHLRVDGVSTPGPHRASVLGPDRYLVRDRHVRLRLDVRGPSLDRGQVERITWRLDGGPAHEVDLGAAADQTLFPEIDLRDRRGAHEVELELRTREDDPQTATALVVLNYHPPAPVIAFTDRWLTATFGSPTSRYRRVKSPDFTLEARVRPTAGVRAAVRFQGRTLPLHADAAGNVRQPLKLAVGENAIEVRAWNDGAAEADRAFEMDSESMLLIYRPDPAPEVWLTTVEQAGEPRQESAVRPGRPVIVTTPTVRVHGDVVAAEAPAVRVSDAKGQPIENAPAARVTAVDGAGRYRFEQRLDLQPGPRPFAFRVRAGTKAATASLVVDYRPPWPEFEVVEPEPDVTLTKGKPPETVTPRLRFTSATPFAFDVVVRVTNGGKGVPQEGGKEALTVTRPRVAPGDQVTLSPLRLAPGPNQVSVVLRRRLPGAARDTETAPVLSRVTYLQPPEVVAVAAKPPVRTPFTTLTARVVSRSRPDNVQVRVNGGDRYTARAARIRETTAPGVREQAWEMVVADVHVPAKENRVEVWAGNSDGMSVAPFAVRVAGVPPAKPPVVQFTTASGTTTEARTRLTFRAESETAVTGAELWQAGRAPEPCKDLHRAEGPQGNVVVTGSFDVSLREGTNRFRVVARNEGGQAEAEVTLSRPRPPIRLEVEAGDRNAPGPVFTLRGRVIFRDEQEAARNERNVRQMRLYVNEFLQGPVQLESRPGQDERVRYWRADVLLNRADNQVEVDCPSLPVDADRRQTFHVRCAEPLAPATLHLLVVGVGEPDAAELARQAFQALQARADPVQGLRSPVFKQVVMHPYDATRPRQVLADYVSPGRVRTALGSIRSWIRTQGSANDVVMIYWRGKDAVRDSQGAWYLPTSLSSRRRPPRQTDVALDELLGVNDAVPGARILLLDAEATSVRPRNLPRDVARAHAGVVYYAWSQAESPLRGLLLAVEKAAARRPISLQDVVQAAEEWTKSHPRALQVEHNLEGRALADVVITEALPRPGSR